MTSVEIPYSIAAALPSLVVLDITNDVQHEVERGELDEGIAYVSPADQGVVRVNERESGLFADLEAMLDRLVPHALEERERLVTFLLGQRTEAVPFSGRRLELGRWQRILLFSFGDGPAEGWHLTLLG